MIGSITTLCSGKELSLLPEKTAGRVGMLLSLSTDQLVTCPDRAHTNDDINHLTFPISGIL